MLLRVHTRYRPCQAYLWTPPILFRRSPPQRNFPTYTVPLGILHMVNLYTVGKWSLTCVYNILWWKCFHSPQRMLLNSHLVCIHYSMHILYVSSQGPRVFSSNHGVHASAHGIQFHWGSGGDSGTIVTPFMRVGNEPTRNFATFKPLELQLPFTWASMQRSPYTYKVHEFCSRASTGQASDLIRPS